jgi:DNA-binding CsgD family transcriptional regulator
MVRAPCAAHDAAMLTARERDVLLLLAHGCTYAGIAERLGISAHTVGTHVKHCYRKLGVRSAAHALARALELKLLSLRDLSPAALPAGERRSVSARVRRS